ncbi:hypothetical protein Halha_0795 [Halobacteroides halobius DSM 5150]|uniref:Rubrerythrin diiron-binding domain-containing protein n=1 Tax=Halobacteroides halobius (strain ATCC 35273 / DSM 5150 / MD-1) TaxID=748449 RepID=L0K6W6_HALHC|nr:ferritin family protein [Halobacteroides halobius]AGB40766.1 hypothetical protein Halha_0795 [Halobacteroides halobius DSM 5150]
MDIQLNGLEILKMAMNIEQQGKEFYQRCAKVNSKPKVKKLFTQLKDDEEEHYQYFKRLLNNLNEEDKSLSKDYLYNEEVSGYLRSLVDSKVFPEDEKVIDEIAHNLEEALKIGIKAEKNSLLLYQELIQVEENSNAIKALEKLILEEKRHLIKLQTMRGEH